MNSRALTAAAALVPALAYEFAELARGKDGWPYSRFIRLLPRPVIVVGLTAAYAVLLPHFLRRAVQAVADAKEAMS